LQRGTEAEAEAEREWVRRWQILSRLHATTAPLGVGSAYKVVNDGSILVVQFAYQTISTISHSSSLCTVVRVFVTSPTAKMGSIATEQSPLKMAKPSFPSEANTKEYAQSLDAKDHMRSFREKFIIPSKANVKSKRVAKPGKSQ
jgi:hypothetical protein